MVITAAVLNCKKKEARAMPKLPKKPCRFPGCPNLTEGRYCKEHKDKANRSYEKYGRDPAVRRRYGRAWKRIRDKYVAGHPFCELCYQEGIIVPVDEVHHKLPLSVILFLYVSHATQKYMLSVVIIKEEKNIVFIVTKT